MVNFLVKKKFLVCGTGSIGVRHIKNLLKLKQEVYVWREQKDKRQEINKIFPKIKIFTSFDHLLIFPLINFPDDFP